MYQHSAILYQGITSYEKTTAEYDTVIIPCASHLAQHPDINESSGLSCYKM